MEARIGLVAALILLGAIFQAHFVRAERNSVPNQFSLMQDLLGLTDDQTAQIEEVFQAAEEDCADADSVAICMGASRSEIEAAISEILTPDQATELSNLRAQRDSFGQGPAQMLSELAQVLDLSAEQQAAIRQTLAEAQSACSSSQTADERRTCLEGQRSQAEQAIRSVLSSDQQSTFSALKEERHGFGCTPSGQRSGADSTAIAGAN